MQTIKRNILFLLGLVFVSQLSFADELKQQVWDTELAFAKSMQQRDLAAFSQFIDEEAIFFNGEDTLTGKTQIVAYWQRFFKGEVAPFSWQPQLVVVLDSGNLAHSSGPVMAPNGKAFMQFNSVWRRNPDGHWRIVFDKGAPLPPATDS
ncbi:YybH family protein [Neptunicella marina]|uniref:Nuclear transport factor 2 family protein n=1 Tax=Neptunicella marina TaxID=2125989 RepID=A0A8J6M272_9ALTE|nr:nuclear transport factor 2 family protein [Neptunicella marina]MBC3766043.1 nuclear transport factor 2 family protein [Neptunicella marina]